MPHRKKLLILTRREVLPFSRARPGRDERSGLRTMPRGLWKVGELAKQMGLSIRTLHYYDEIGLLSPSHHTE